MVGFSGTGGAGLRDTADDADVVDGWLDACDLSDAAEDGKVAWSRPIDVVASWVGSMDVGRLPLPTMFPGSVSALLLLRSKNRRLSEALGTTTQSGSFVEEKGLNGRLVFRFD